MEGEEDSLGRGTLAGGRLSKLTVVKQLEYFQHSSMGGKAKAEKEGLGGGPRGSVRELTQETPGKTILPAGLGTGRQGTVSASSGH